MRPPNSVARCIRALAAWVSAASVGPLYGIPCNGPTSVKGAHATGRRAKDGTGHAASARMQRTCGGRRHVAAEGPDKVDGLAPPQPAGRSAGRQAPTRVVPRAPPGRLAARVPPLGCRPAVPPPPVASAGGSRRPRRPRVAPRAQLGRPAGGAASAAPTPEGRSAGGFRRSRHPRNASRAIFAPSRHLRDALRVSAGPRVGVTAIVPDQGDGGSTVEVGTEVPDH